MVKAGDLIVLDNDHNVLVLNVLEYKKEEYALVNEVVLENGEEKLTDTYSVMKIVDGGMLRVIDEDILKELLALFSKSVDKIIKIFDFNKV